MSRVRWVLLGAVAGFAGALLLTMTLVGLRSPPSQRSEVAHRPAPSALDTVGEEDAPRSQAVRKKEAAPMGQRQPREAMAGAAPRPAAPGAAAVDAPAQATVEGKEAAAAPARSWFPETFLFEPLVVTDDAGLATVSARVPDRLTTWRVLALAHSRQGAQAGATATFLGTLPAYVDPVVPGFLMAGDEVRLPVQIVNTTERELSQPLRVSARGAALSGAPGSVRVPPHGSRVEYATLRAERAGTVQLEAALGDTDAVTRQIPVWPTGRAVEVRRGGTLAAPREVALQGPADLQSDGARLRLLVYPGALALLRSELGAAGSRGGVAEDAYALGLAGSAPALIRSLGDEPDEPAVRALALTSTQRALRHARKPSLWAAALLADAASARQGDPVLRRLSERMAEQVARAQRPDGTFAGADGWTAQRLLTATAECVRALRVASAASDSDRLKQRAAAAALRASGAFERHFGRVDDAYTAAAIAASGAVRGPLLDKLRARVREAVRVDADGSRSLPVPEGAQRPDGQAPSDVEATALAALALQDDPAASWRADLGASLLAAYTPGRGWGDGRTNLVALRAALSLFQGKLPARVRIVLEQDGQPLREGALDARHVRDTLALDAPGAAGRHVYTVRAEPAVPGLGFSLALSGTVPWKDEPAASGLQLSIRKAGGGALQGRVGAPVDVQVEAAAPAGRALRIRHALPAGAQPDASSLDALVSSGALTAWRAEEGAVVLDAPPLAPGQSLSIRYRVVPTLGGRLHGGASSVAMVGRADVATVVPPQPWQVF